MRNEKNEAELISFTPLRHFNRVHFGALLAGMAAARLSVGTLWYPETELAEMCGNVQSEH